MFDTLGLYATFTGLQYNSRMWIIKGSARCSQGRL